MNSYSTFGKIIFGVFALIGGLAVAAAVIFGFAALFAWFTMLLVNFLFTTKVLLLIFGTSKLTFWQALCLNLITGILFKSSTITTKKG